MMNVLGKTLLALIAAIMVANPVMACCFPAALGSEQVVFQNDEPPCHGTKSLVSKSQDLAAGVLDLSCPGCGDCSSAMMATEFTDTVAAVSTLEDEFNFAVAVDTLGSANPAVKSVAYNIPSGPSPRSISTPITLKQRLLI